MSSIRSFWLEMKGLLRASRRMINAGLEPLGLSGAEGDILFHLMTGSDGMRQEQLAEQLDIGKAAISRLIDALEKKGYALRVRQAADKRAYSISLTERGSALEEGVKAAYDRLYALVREQIADEELGRIESLLARISASLQVMGDTTP